MILKTLRGGSWSLYAQSFRSACRNGFGPDRRYIDLGFRVLRPALKFKRRMLRGGSWFDFRNRAHKTPRLYNPLPRNDNYGFRVVR